MLLFAEIGERENAMRGDYTGYCYELKRSTSFGAILSNPRRENQAPNNLVHSF